MRSWREVAWLARLSTLVGKPTTGALKLRGLQDHGAPPNLEGEVASWRRFAEEVGVPADEPILWPVVDGRWFLTDIPRLGPCYESLHHLAATENKNGRFMVHDEPTILGYAVVIPRILKGSVAQPPEEQERLIQGLATGIGTSRQQAGLLNAATLAGILLSRGQETDEWVVTKTTGVQDSQPGFLCLSIGRGGVLFATIATGDGNALVENFFPGCFPGAFYAAYKKVA